MVRLLTVFGIATLALAAWWMRDHGAQSPPPLPAADGHVRWIALDRARPWTIRP